MYLPLNFTLIYLLLLLYLLDMVTSSVDYGYFIRWE